MTALLKNIFMQNDIEQIKLNHKENKYHDLIDYVLSRTLIVFFFKLTFGTLKNIYHQLNSFNELGFIEVLIGFLTGLSILLAILILINITFTLLRIKFKRIKQFYNENGLVKSFKIFFSNFFDVFHKNYVYEIDRDGKKYFYNDLQAKESIVYNYEIKEKSILRENKLSQIFYVIAIISISFFKGNSFINNYYGIYNSYISGVTREGQEITSENNLMVIDKKEWGKYDLEVKYFVDNYSDNVYEENVKYKHLTKEDKREFDNLELDFSNRGYFFQESAFFDGFTSWEKENDFVSQCKYFGFYIIEKSLITLLFFFLPFITVLYYFVIEKKKRKKYVILSVLIFPFISFLGYPSEIFQSDTYTTCLLFFIGLINIFPITSIYYKFQNRLNDKKLMDIINMITIISIVVFAIAKGYLMIWGKLFLIIPLLIWWLIVTTLRKEVE